MKILLPYLFLLAILFQGCGGFVRYARDEVQEQTAIANGDFRLRLSKLVSAPGMTSSRYLIESSSSGERWAETFRWSQDDPWPLADIEMNTVTPTFGYFFNMVNLGVTVDAGKTWKVLNVYETMKKDGTYKIADRFDRGITRIVINEGGTGSIYAQSYHNKNGEKQDIYTTNDFGQNWQLVAASK